VGRTDIRVENPAAFFERGHKFSKLADRGEAIPHSRVIAFEDIQSLLRVLTGKRVLLLKQIQRTPGSISALAERLNRDRSAVTRDIQVLERYGVIQVSERPLAGHGRQKWIAPVAGEVRLTAVL
jgi:predicted transcriptional regulator